MAEPYTQTAVPFEQFPLAALRDPVLAGPGIDGMGAAADRYRQLAETLQRAAEDLRVAMTAAQGAHEGEAAEASRRYVERVAAVGELGAGQARIAVGALDDGAAYYGRVADDMRALQPDDASPPRNVAQAAVRDQQVEQLRVLAVEAAQRYESNTNWSLGRTFQPFEPPVVAAPGAGGAALSAGGGAGPGSPGTAVAAGLPAGGADVPVGAGAGSPAAPGGSGSAGAGGSGVPGAGGPGAGGGGAGGPGAGGAGLLGTATPVGPGASGAGGVSGPGGSGPAGSGRPGAGGAGAVGPRAGSGVGGPPRTSTAALYGGARPDAALPDAALPGPDPSARAAAGPRDAAGTGTGWVPGTPWTGRTPPEGGAAGPRGVPAEPPSAASPRTGTPGGPAAGRSTPGATPFLPAAGVGRGQGSEHARPSWLVEDDPQAYWFAGLPDVTAGVIGGEGDADH
ncbi:hypothetical protein GCM10017691_16270 [Pseudonocardia petroleophila]|uniref:PPE family protein n=1 Tax=Pseudonocardia petroleophila TaxID=37331 RepID=A0A7G7MHP2_9PSEU|nr:hypothetical protein [Pseudonocardia petroleophila]QNG52303.1 hypothetical protein H6H00_30430 [Pseudonocardia petroleophila]